MEKHTMSHCFNDLILIRLVRMTTSLRILTSFIVKLTSRVHRSALEGTLCLVGVSIELRFCVTSRDGSFVAQEFQSRCSTPIMINIEVTLSKINID